MTTANDLDIRSWTRKIASPFYDGFDPFGPKYEATLNALSFTPTTIIEASALSDGAQHPSLTADGDTVASTDKIASDYGSKSFKMSIANGQTGFGQWGCGFVLPTPLVKGQSIHCQWSTCMPSDFDWTSAGEGSHLKFFRIHTRSSGAANEGYNDIYISNEAAEAGRDGALKHITEVFENSWTLSSEKLTKDVWETFEMRVDFDDVALDSAGAGRTRIWKNKSGVMTLILDITDQKTLNTSTSECDLVYLFTYWNGGSPQDNTCYMDRLVVETDLSKLVETDAGGTNIIGGLI